jgi:hypothetical protein
LAREYVTLFASKEGQALLRRHCRRMGLPIADLRQLVEEVIEKDSMAKRAGLWQAFDDILDTPAEESSGQAEE